MKPFSNIEIFDRELNFKANTAVESVDINLDYLDPEQNTLSIRDVDSVGINDIIRIAGEDGEYFGIVSEIPVCIREKKISWTFRQRFIKLTK